MAGSIASSWLLVGVGREVTGRERKELIGDVFVTFDFVVNYSSLLSFSFILLLEKVRKKKRNKKKKNKDKRA